MKILLAIFLAILLTFARSSATEEAIEVLEGILVGAFGPVGKEVRTCIKDGEVIFKDIESAIGHLENAVSKHSKTELIAGLKSIAAALKLVPEEVKDCKALPTVVKDIEKIVAEFSNPVELVIEVGEKILWHGISIFRDVDNSVKDWKAHQYYKSGEDIGDIIKIIFIKMVRGSADNAVVFTKAFYAAAFKIKLGLDTCEAEVAQSWDEVVAAIELMEGGTVADISAGVAALMKAIPDMIHSFEDCEADWPAIKEGLDDMMPFVNHPASIIVAISEAVALDPISFPRDAYNIYSAFTSDPVNFQLGGQASGDVMQMVLKYMPHDTIVAVEQLIKSSY